MKKLPFLLSFLLLGMGLMAQQSLLVFLEASEKKPFYVKIGSKTNAASTSGQVYVTDLTGTNFEIFVGFPETDLPEYRFQVALRKNDNSFQLKQAGQGWTLIDLETNKVILPGATAIKTSMPLGGVRKTDAFSVMMAGVVNDTSVLYTSVISVPEESKQPAANPSPGITGQAGDVAATGDAAGRPAITKQPLPVEPGGREKIHSTTQVDSTRVKHIDSSLALQQERQADSVRRQAEILANNSQSKEVSATVPFVSKPAIDSAKKDNGVDSKADSGVASIVTAEAAGRVKALKDSLDNIVVKSEQANKDSIAREAIAKDAAARDAAAKDVAMKDAAMKDAAAKDAEAKNAAAKDSVMKDVAAKDAVAKDEASRNSAAKDSTAKDVTARDAAAKDAAAKDAAVKDAAAKDAVAKYAAIKDAALKDATIKEAAAKDSVLTVARNTERAAREAADLRNQAATKDSLQRVASVANAAVIKISEKKETKEFTAIYTVKEANAKSDTVRIIIPIDSPFVTGPRSDSVFPRWQSNPRPLTDPVVSKKDSVTPSSRETNAGTASGTVPGTTAGKPSGQESSTVVGQTTEANQRTAVNSGTVNGSSPTKGPVMVNSDCVNFATEYDLDKLRVKMIAEVSADDRVAVAKKVFRTKCFTTRQIRALTELFLNDEGKYKFLDTAYPFVSDSQEFRNLVTVLKEDYYVKRFNAMIRL